MALVVRVLDLQERIFEIAVRRYWRVPPAMLIPPRSDPEANSSREYIRLPI